MDLRQSRGDPPVVPHDVDPAPVDSLNPTAVANATGIDWNAVVNGDVVMNADSGGPFLSTVDLVLDGKAKVVVLAKWVLVTE